MPFKHYIRRVEGKEDYKQEFCWVGKKVYFKGYYGRIIWCVVERIATDSSGREKAFGMWHKDTWSSPTGGFVPVSDLKVWDE